MTNISKTIHEGFSEPTYTTINEELCSTNNLEKIIDEEIPILKKEKNPNTIFNTQNLDIVQHPNHYGAGENGLQCIEAMLQTFGKEATMAFCKLNSFKYLWRSDHKNKEQQDIEKSKRYLEYWLVLNKIQKSV